MKKLMLIVAGSLVGFAAFSQPKIRGGAGGYGTIRQSPPARVIIVQPNVAYGSLGAGMGFGYNRFGYARFGYSPFGYSPFNNPYDRQNYNQMPTQLQLDIEEVNNEYSERIDAVKDDKSLSRQERKQQVRTLKHEREDAIIKAKRRYLNTR